MPINTWNLYGARKWTPPNTLQNMQSDYGSTQVGQGSDEVVVNPWQRNMQSNYEQAGQRPYGGEWRQGVAQAMTLGNRDYEGDLRRMAAEDTQKQITRADNQLGQLGMRELALRPDIQQDRAKMAQDATTRAVVQSQGIKANALDTMRGMLSSADSSEMERISRLIAAANSGSGNYNDFMQMLLPLMARYGMDEQYGSSSGGGVMPGPRQIRTGYNGT